MAYGHGMPHQSSRSRHSFAVSSTHNHAFSTVLPSFRDTAACGIVAISMGFAATAHAQEPTASESTTQTVATTPTTDRWRLAGVPTLNYSTDEGFGFGGVATLYHLDDHTKPYKDAITLKIFISTKLIQAHELNWDAVDIAGLPLRLWSRIGYYSTITQNFCGYGNLITCDLNDAKNDGIALGLSGDDLDTYTNTYYRLRFQRPYADANARLRLRPMPHKTELMLGWRGNLYLPGDLQSTTPYPNSAYAQFFPDGERGFSSVLQVGVTVDNRNHEPYPTRGYFVETSLRGASFLWGSTWNYAGINVAGSLYTPLHPQAVLASRLVFDATVGDVPTEDMARIGGTVDSIAFGGNSLGRGVREHRYLGKVKLMQQNEVRTMLASLDVLEQHFDFGLTAFADVGLVGYDFQDWRGVPLRLINTYGVGGRLLWDQNFAVRLEFGFSPVEKYEPFVYINVGNSF